MGKLLLIFIVFILTFMGKTIIPEIRDNYQLYNTLLKDRKSIFEDIVDISKTKGSNKNFLLSDATLKHSTLSNEILFIAEVKVNNHKYFLFKIMCTVLSKTPFFRFDSDGATHRNYDENIPLTDQIITTPHFNCFNEKGESVAYKTEQLKNEQERVALEDINLCMSHFCYESNIRLNDDEYPGISILSSTLQLPIIKDDPNSGVEFI